MQQEGHRWLGALVSYWEPRELHGRGGSLSLAEQPGAARWCRPPADIAPCARSVAPRGLRVPTIPARQQKGRVAPAWGGGTAGWSVAGGARVRIRRHLCWQRPGAPGPSNERGLCLRSPCPPHFTLFNRVWTLFPPPSQHTRACVRAWSVCLKKKGKKQNHSQ